MLKARMPGPGTPVVVYGDAAGTCRYEANRREWRVVAEVNVPEADNEASWGVALRQLLEHRARVLMVPGEETVSSDAATRGRRIRDVALHHSRLFYSETSTFQAPPDELTRARGRDS